MDQQAPGHDGAPSPGGRQFAAAGVATGMVLSVVVVLAVAWFFAVGSSGSSGPEPITPPTTATTVPPSTTTTDPVTQVSLLPPVTVDNTAPTSG